MHIPPGALHRIIQEDGTAPTGLEQTIHSMHTPGRSLGCIPPVARSGCEWDLLAGARQADHLLKDVERPGTRRIHLSGSVGQPELHERILHDSCAITEHAHLRLLAEMLQSA